MAINDPAAIKFSNEQFRVAADRLGRCYYRSIKLRDAWVALEGTNDEKFAILSDDIRSYGTLLGNTWRFCFWADRLWQSGSIGTLFPNDPLEIVEDGAPADGRGVVNSQDLRRLKNHMESFVNWLAKGTDLDKHFLNDSNATAPTTYVYFDDIARVAGDGAKEPVTNWGRIVAVERTDDLITEYTVTTPAALNHILKVAVNAGEV